MFSNLERSMLLVSTVLCIVAVKSLIPVNVVSNIALESHGGRYTQIKLGNDSLPLMVYHDEGGGSSAGGSCVGIAHCENPLCENITLVHLDPSNNPNNGIFIYLRMSPITGLPQLSYILQNSSLDGHSVLNFVTCYVPSCGLYQRNQIYSSLNKPPAYSMFSYDGKPSKHPLITVFVENDGLAIIKCRDANCQKHDEPTLVAKGAQNGKYPSIVTIQPSNTNTNDYYCIFVYYNEGPNDLDLEYTIMNMNTKAVNHGYVDKATNGHDIGKYAFMALSVNDTINNKFVVSVMYTDQTNGDLKYSYCNISYIEMKLTCFNRVVDNIGVAAYDVFPEMDIYTDFQQFPILSYFNSTSESSGAIKFMECNSIECDEPYIKELASGNYGYGRDSSIAYFNGETNTNTKDMLYVSFLDYNQNGTDKIARLLVLETDT